MIKSLLIGLDGSAPSMAAMEEGAKWAVLLGAELRGLFVEDDQRFLYYPTGFSAEGGIPIASPLVSWNSCNVRKGTPMWQIDRPLDPLRPSESKYRHMGILQPEPEQLHEPSAVFGKSGRTLQGWRVRWRMSQIHTPWRIS